MELSRDRDNIEVEEFTNMDVNWSTLQTALDNALEYGEMGVAMATEYFAQFGTVELIAIMLVAWGAFCYIREGYHGGGTVYNELGQIILIMGWTLYIIQNTANVPNSEFWTYTYAYTTTYLLFTLIGVQISLITGKGLRAMKENIGWHVPEKGKAPSSFKELGEEPSALAPKPKPPALPPGPTPLPSGKEDDEE